MQCVDDVTSRRVRVTIVCRGKVLSVTCSECVSAVLGIQHANRICHMVICSPALLYNIFPHYLINGKIFRKYLHQEPKIVLYSIWYHHNCRWPSRAQVESCIIQF